MKPYYLLPVLLLTVACNPFDARQEATRQAMSDAKEKAARINQEYAPKIREIKPYQVYRYQIDLSDPFREREFIAQEKDDDIVPNIKKGVEPRCVPPACVPPKLHPKSLLENYGLDTLSFVGTLGANSGVALVKTPDFGVVPVRVGEYMGRNNGIILEIKENAIILQEKLEKNGLWEDKKTVLMIK